MSHTGKLYQVCVNMFVSYLLLDKSSVCTVFRSQNWFVGDLKGTKSGILSLILVKVVVTGWLVMKLW